MKSTSHVVYVYYRIAEDLSEEALSAMRAHRDRLDEEGWTIAFSRRPEGAHSQTTWMEACGCDSLDAAGRLVQALEHSAKQCGLAALAPTGRHVEVFVSVVP